MPCACRAVASGCAWQPLDPPRLRGPSGAGPRELTADWRHTAAMDARQALTGALPFVVLLAAVLSAPLCALLLWLYRRAVIRGMGQRSGAGGEPPHGVSGGEPRNPPPALRLLQLDAASAGADNAAWRHARRAPWQSAAVYAAAGLVYALVMALAFQWSDGMPLLPVRTIFLMLCHLWPAVLAMLLVAAYDRLHRTALLVAYFATVAGLWFTAPHEGGGGGLGELVVLWLLLNGPASVLLAAFMWRRIRAVGPLVLSFMVLALLGSQLIIGWMAADARVLQAVTDVAFGIGLGGVSTFYGVMLLGMLLASAAGWPLLRWLARRYQARAFSEMSLSVDALFLIFAVAQSIGFVFSGAWWVLSGLLAFAAARATAALLWRWQGPSPAPAARLLLLRVFALGARSEALFDRLRRHWQPLGPMAMIAGPDLVTATVEPHEFLDFMSGDLARRFVSDRADLQRRLAGFDARPTPDGRHRINELFCRANTWQMSMQRLASASDAVLMDLRSFSASNRGCRYEIGRLLDSVDLRRVVLLVDKTTEMPFLEATLQELWRQLAADSPNRHPGAAVRLMRIDTASHAAMVALLGHLLARA